MARLRADEEGEATDADEIVYQAVATLPPTTAATGKPGVSRPQVRAHTKKTEPTIRRALDRLEAADRVFVTGQMTKRGKLYGVKGNENKDKEFVTSPESAP